ncbi:hypothetical protein JCM8097_007327 [Rhodosporidiobolus ruineniae]
MAGYERLPATPNLSLSDKDPLAYAPGTPGDNAHHTVETRWADEDIDAGGASAADGTYATRQLAKRAQKRQLLGFAVLLSLALLVLARTFRPTSSSSSSSISPGTPHRIHPTLVGPRPRVAPGGTSRYTSCSATDFLASLKTAKIRPNGLSRTPNFEDKPTSVQLPPFEWSFELGELEGGKRCELPEAFSSEEACELLGSFGGLFITGDSFARHLHSAFLMLLRNRNDGAVVDYLITDDCRQDQLFNDGKECRNRIYADTHAQRPVCNDLAQLRFIQTYKPDHVSFKTFEEWHATIPPRNQMYSPVYITGLGGHMNYNTSTLAGPTSDYFDTLFSTLSHHFPTPLNLFEGIHAVPDNIPKMFRERQGRPKVNAYREQVPLLLAERSEEREAYRGAARYVDFFEMSAGAKSFDGVHYSYQVNMEKAQIFLTLLDILWGEIVAAGGMVERG